MRQELETRIQTYAGERRFTAASLQRWLALGEEDAAALLDLAGELRLGENQLCDLWEWSGEIAARDGQSLARVLTGDDLETIRRSSLGRNDKLARLKTALRRRRFPELTRAEDRLSQLVESLALPRAVKMSWPPFLEGDAVRVEIVATTSDELEQAAQALARAAASPKCEEIFATLRGEGLGT